MKQNNNTGQTLQAHPLLLDDGCLTFFNYREQTIKNIINKIKNDKDFLKLSKSSEAKTLINQLLRQICKIEEDFARSKSDSSIANIRLIIVTVPSTSYWMSKKNFDHMHILIKQLIKFSKSKINYIPFALVPRVSKGSQKRLTKEQRIIISKEAYTLSLFFRKILKDGDCNIIIIDDIHTTGSTIKSCASTISNYVDLINRQEKNKQSKNKNGNEASGKIRMVNIKSLTIAYEP